MASVRPYTFSVFDSVLERILKQKKEAPNVLKAVVQVIRRLKPNPKDTSINKNTPILLNDQVWKVRFKLSGTKSTRGGRLIYCQPHGEPVLNVVHMYFKSEKKDLTAKEKVSLVKELGNLEIAKTSE